MQLMITRSFTGTCTQCKEQKIIKYRNEKAKPYCSECADNLDTESAKIQSGFKNKLSHNFKSKYLNSLPSEKVPKPPKKKSRKRGVQVNNQRRSKIRKIFGKHKGTSEELVMYRICLELETQHLTSKQMLLKLEGYTESYGRVSCLMGQMRSKGIIDGAYLNKRGEMTYFLPQNRAIFGSTVNILFKDDVPKILQERGSLTMAEIIKIVNRPRPTVSKWIRQLELENVIQWEIIRIKGKHGTFKLISLI
jgi:hypothetical protein